MMLGFAPYVLAHLGREQVAKSVWGALECALGLRTPILSAHLACELRTLLAKCASRAQPSVHFKSAPDRLVRTTAGFTIFPSFVASGTKKYVCRM